MCHAKTLLRTLSYYLLMVAVIGGVSGLLYFTQVITILRLISILYISAVLAVPFLLAGIGVYQLLQSERNARLDGCMKLLLALFCFGAFVYISLIEPNNLQIEQISISHPHVSETMTIIHISDIQSKKVGRYERKVFEKLKEIPVDLILHTGDLVQPFYYTGYDVSRYEPELRKLAQLFRQLRPRYGVYNVIGDTEIPHKISLFDELSGVKTLQDEEVIIPTPKGELNILGLTLESSRQANTALIDAWIRRSEQNQLKILMGHAPDYIRKVLDTDINLCLAGHTHGGQIHLPFLGPLLSSSNIPKSWVRGFRQIRSVSFNVSSGVGVSHAWSLPPMRFRCPPQITVFRIIPEYGT